MTAIAAKVIGSLANDGYITVTATQQESDSVPNAVQALGMYADVLTDDGEMWNTGDIAVTASGTAASYTSTNYLAFAAGAAGIYVGELAEKATLINSGKVVATAEGTVEEAYALYIDEGNGNFTNEKSGKLYGGVFTGKNDDGAVDVINHGVIRPTLGQMVEILGD